MSPRGFFLLTDVKWYNSIMSQEADIFAGVDDYQSEIDFQSDLDDAEIEWKAIKEREERRVALERLEYKLWTRLQNISEA
jgi:hypothetical protein